MYFDTHAHYDNDAFDADRPELLAAMPSCGVGLILNPGCDEGSSHAAIKLAGQFDHVYAAVGWHPHEAKSFGGGEALLREWVRGPKVMAIGEIGLDYYYDHSPRDVQRTVFEKQLALACELELPVIIHDREAHGDCMDIIRRYPEARGVFHCYSGSAEMAIELVRMGWHLSFTGAITYKNARRAIETIKTVPGDRIMLETDCPYLAPVPNRGKRNDSSFLPLTAQVIAETRGMTVGEVEELTWENGLRFFGISRP